MNQSAAMDPFALLPDLIKAGRYRQHDQFEQLTREMADRLASVRKKGVADRILRIVGTRLEPKTLEALSGHIREGKVFAIQPERSLSSVYLTSKATSSIALLLSQWKGADKLKAAGVRPANRVMLHGPTGCGKTALAEAIAYELGRPLFIVNAGALVASYLGESAKNLTGLVNAVKGDCVLFIDEVDSIASRRAEGSESAAQENRRLVNTLLLLLDRIDPEVLLVAATNTASAIDDAAFGRFDLSIEIPAPDEDAVRFVAEARLGEPGYGEAISQVSRRNWKSLRELEAACDHIHRGLILGQDAASVLACICS